MTFYTLEDLKCLAKPGCGQSSTTDFTQQKNIQGLPQKLKEFPRLGFINPIPVAERVNYDFVKASTLTDLLDFF